MLQSLTLFNQSGVVLYQYVASPSLLKHVDDPVSHALEGINTILSQFLMDPTNEKQFHIIEGVTFVWKQQGETYGLATYPDIFFEGPRQFLKDWAQRIVAQSLKEYHLYQSTQTYRIRPDPQLFDTTFKVILETSKNKESHDIDTDTDARKVASPLVPTSTAANKATQKKRNWHDGTAKVTDKAMQELDKSDDKERSTEHALREARQTYMPTDADLEEEAEPETSEESMSSLTTWLGQFTGNRVLTAQDLEQPLQRMNDKLTSKNVAQPVASQLCQILQQKLVGKKLNSLYRVQTAIQQSLEDIVAKILQNDVDLVRNISRHNGSSFSLMKSAKRPYVIAVCGINGVGKSTSVAKLAYHFQSHKCRPLLVAGDTFRSGAVEQLQIHADCLQIPLYSQGYSKDPSAVAKAAIQHAMTEGNHDVVLIDTAGRMQNNVPLMKALGKLVQENQPDFVMLVCEALVGHDGLSQFTMFQDALGPKRKMDGLLLTKFDTVSDKVGAALTLTHQTGVPIVFCGTGQKYHHLKKLDPATIVKSLFS